jgi:NAD(P) transhydrogenase
MRDFDLVVIGGGAAGERGAVQAAALGRRVALVERAASLGGAMVNTGTLPSKTLRESALYLSGFRQRGLHGVEMGLTRRATVDDLLFRLDQVVATERRRIEDTLARHGVTRVQGEARFVDAHTLAVAGPSGEERLTAAHVLIATGSAPRRPAAFPFEHLHVYDSDEIVRVHTLPRAMVVVGGGVIGCEYACLFAALGAKVTVVEARPTILGFLDGELVSLLEARMRALGVDFRKPAQVEACQPTADGVVLTLKDGERLEVDLALICAGRQGNTAALQLEAAGLSADARGQLAVDARFRTQVPHIAAVGDVIGFPALASTSMEQARVAVTHLLTPDARAAMTPLFPYGIFTIPEAAMVGETEEALAKAGVACVKGVADFGHNARGAMIGETGRLKLLFRRDDLALVGVHCLGEGAVELVHVGMMGMLSGATARVFADACFNYPTLSEAYKAAAEDALARAR